MRIAILDDNQLDIDYFKARAESFLKKKGDRTYQISEYTSGVPLVDDVKDGEWFDLIVLDIILKDGETPGIPCGPAYCFAIENCFDTTRLFRYAALMFTHPLSAVSPVTVYNFMCDMCQFHSGMSLKKFIKVNFEY